MPNRQNFFLTMGEDATLSMTARSRSGAVLNLTGATITWRMGVKGKTVVLEKTGSVVSASLGTFTVSLTDSDLDPSLYKSRTYSHQTFVTISGTTTMAASGTIRLDDEIAAAS